MKPFELMYQCCEPGLPVLYKRVRQILRTIAEPHRETAKVLDIGGRKSHYTIGIPGRVTISELPRRSAVQHRLHLGVNDQITAQIRKRRSNVEQVVMDDMTQSALKNNSFDCAIAVEVLEHVEQDQDFVRHVHRVLKPNGTFVMTTPNGDFVRNTNPDHKRHYRKTELEALLRNEFEFVDVRYAVPHGKFYAMALESWSIRRPWKTAKAFCGAILNSLEDRYAKQPSEGYGMQELIAVARKSQQPIRNFAAD
jgi:SAM-dependent methyltransferase